MSGGARPLPGDVVPDAIDQPMWDALRDGTLLVYRCGRCGRVLWPAGACPEHGGDDMSWVAAKGTGTVDTWTVVHQRYSRSFSDEPATVVVVRLDEGPFLHTNLVGGRSPVSGMRVRLSPTAVGAAVLPLFAPED